MVMFGISEASKGTGRSLPRLLSSVARMPLATTPWWKSLMAMNENKMVGGLNMLSWWDREGNLDRVIDPLRRMIEGVQIQPVVAAAFPFDRAGEAHEYIAERRNVGKVILVP